MAYDAKIIEVMIASPSDVQAERTIVREVLAEWNVIHARDRGVAFLPVGWETHSAPDLGGRPQQLINDRILARVDVLVGIFWTRVGSPTGKAISGSVEEIEEHLKAGKPVMLYFSSQPIIPDNIDPEQYADLKSFKTWAFERGLVASYEDVDDFRARFNKDIQINLSINPILKSLLQAVPTNNGGARTPAQLSDEALQMVRAAAAHQHGQIMIHRTLGGTMISAGDQRFGQPDSHRTMARWEAVVDELRRSGMIKDVNGRGIIFELTNAGYNAA